MKMVSLKLQEGIFADTEALLNQLKQNRNSYINEAVNHYNRLQKRLLLAKQLQEESRLVAHNSLEVLNDMEQLEDNILLLP
ncbi:MAG: hypothetical protein ABIQ93_08075 [Saprospiraceae bacterium]